MLPPAAPAVVPPPLPPAAPAIPARPRMVAPRSPDELIASQTRIGNYRLVRLLGQGGMGAVYLAEHIEIGKRAAVKILNAQQANDEESVGRFLGEARLISGLKHPSIVDIYDCGLIEDVGRYILMEHLEGEDLYVYLKRRVAVSPAEAAGIGWQILDALEAAHEAGVIHRDLKPPNIFLARWGRRTLVKLLDFGVAKLLDSSQQSVELTRTGMVVGTPAYMAPEQAAGGKDPDGRLDLYSFGLILFEMVAGRRPFLSNNTNEMLVMQQVEQPPPPSAFAPGLPKAFERLIMGCLEKSVNDRPKNARILKEALAALMHDLPTQTLSLLARPTPNADNSDQAPEAGPGAAFLGEPGAANFIPMQLDGLAPRPLEKRAPEPATPPPSQSVKAAAPPSGKFSKDPSIANSYAKMAALRSSVTGEGGGLLVGLSDEELADVAQRATMAVRPPTQRPPVMRWVLLGAGGGVALVAILVLLLLWVLGPRPASAPPVAVAAPVVGASTISVDTRPSGARILDDKGILLGQTPQTIVVPDAGFHVTLEADGFRSVVVPLLPPFAKNSLEITLKALPTRPLPSSTSAPALSTIPE
jgi:serine/threonine-protein kinase